MIRAFVIDVSTGIPLAIATVALVITGQENVNLTATNDGARVAEMIWQIQKANKRGQGGTAPGTYTVTLTCVTADGYT